MKKISTKEKILLTILSFLLSLSICWRSGNSFQYITFLVVAIIILIILIYVWPKIVNIKSQKNNEIRKWEFIIYALIICLPLVIGILAHFPGITTSDTGSQWIQIQNNQYSNWHPVMHTLFALKLPSLFYNNILSATIFQCLIILAILLYFCYFCRKNFLNFYQTLIVLIMVVANPLFICFSVTIWKDITYSWFMFLATLFLIKIVISDGDWLLKNKNKIVFILSILGIMLFRHNGIASVLIMFIWLIIFYPKVRKLSTIMFIGMFAFYFILTGPIYKALNVDNRTGGKGEISGEIMGQISYYYNNGAEFTKKELRLLEDIASLDKWQKFYYPRNFNNLKWNSDNYSGALEENFSEYLKLYFKKSLQYPAMFVKSFLNMTSPVWETNS